MAQVLPWSCKVTFHNLRNLIKFYAPPNIFTPRCTTYCTFYALCLVSVPLRFQFIEKCKDRKLISTGQMTSRTKLCPILFTLFKTPPIWHLLQLYSYLLRFTAARMAVRGSKKVVRTPWKHGLTPRDPPIHFAAVPCPASNSTLPRSAVM